MSCKSESNSNSSIYVSKKSSVEIKELLKVKSIEAANNLIKDGYVFLSVYWNTNEAHEEYILGKINEENKPDRQVGFLRD
ncbi:hypothetical protein [Desulfolucanica intricata]|uniref:hypothetical protein n=1 Tax=Desulfolucanica intricata TaxID=1285191 RepID=UPI000B227507|nr:hypothetical protein [Desulfolucanica intricata]